MELEADRLVAAGMEGNGVVVRLIEEGWVPTAPRVFAVTLSFIDNACFDAELEGNGIVSRGRSDAAPVDEDSCKASWSCSVSCGLSGLGAPASWSCSKEKGVDGKKNSCCWRVFSLDIKL